MALISCNWRLALYFLITLVFYACGNEPTISDQTINHQPEASEERLRLMVSTNITKAEQAGASGQLDSAIFWYTKASDNWLSLQNWDSLHATAIDAFYLSYEFYDFEPIKPYLEGFTVLIPPALDTIKAKFLEIQGFIAYEEGDSERALGFYKAILPIWKKYQRDDELGGIYNMLGILYHNLEDYPLAEQFYREGLRLSRISSDSLSESNNYDNLGRALFQQGNWEEAIECFKKSYALVPSEDGFHEHSLALAYNSAGQHELAIKLAKEALQKTSVFEGYNYLGLSEAYRTLGDVYKGSNDFEKAEKYYRLCLEKCLERSGEAHRDVARARINLGEAYQAQSLWNLAIREYHSAIQVFLPAFHPQSMLDCPSSDSLLSREGYLMEALRYKGQCLLKKAEQSGKREELQAASQHLRAAVQFIHQIKLFHTETGAKAFYGEKYSLPYLEDALQAQLQVYRATNDPRHQEVAFELAQQATAFLLRESINERRAMEVAQVPADTVDLLHHLNADIVKVQSTITEGATSAATDSLQQQLFELKRSRLALLEKVEADYAKYYEMKHALNPIPLSRLQDELDSNTLAIKYFMGKEQLYLFAFSRQSFQTFVQPVDAAFYERVAHFRKTLTDLDYLREAPLEAERLFLSSSHYLYQQLLAPALEAFEGENLNQLTLIPDGILNYLSFECLLTTPADSWLEQEAYLLDRYAIRYAYFAGLLTKREAEPPNRSSRFLGFGTEYDNQTLDQLNIIQQDSLANQQVNEALRGKKLGKIAYADDEVREIADLLDGKAFLNKEATKSNFLNNISGYEAIHIAAHGFIDTENDSTAFIVFNEEGDSEDFLLSLPEIYGLKLNARLVALSACQTGTGALQRSEGVMSLARAFQFAGSNSLLASQWNLSDRSSSVIMKNFYQELKAGHPKSEALRRAKLSYLTDDAASSPAYRSPAYWGAIVLIGEDSPLEFEPAGISGWWRIPGGILLLLLAVLAYRKFI